MMTITRHTDPTTLDDCGRQILATVTPRTDPNDAWLEIIDGEDGDHLSDLGVELMADHGIESRDDYSIGDYLEGQILDYRTLRSSTGEIMELHLLVGYGGPNIWQVIDESGNCETRVSWWGTIGRGEDQHELYARIFEYVSEVIACTE